MSRPGPESRGKDAPAPDPAPLDDPRLRRDLAELAREDREALGRLPTAEELLAYRDGELEAAEAERVGRWLGADPELASLLLDLEMLEREEPFELPGQAEATADLEAGWADVRARSGGEPSGSAAIAPSLTRHRTALAVAAAFVLGLLATAAWLLRGPDPTLPEGIYLPVWVESTVYREARELEPPASTAGLELRIPVELLGPGERWRLELKDSTGRATFSGEAAAPASGPLIWRVPLEALPAGKPIALEVRSTAAPPGSEAVLHEVFRIRLEE